MKKRLTIAMLLLAFTGAAKAEQLPPGALDKDYENCMGGESAQKDPARAQYCNCVRQQLSGWTTDQYGQVATEAKNNGATAPAAIEQIAKTCLAQALHQ